MDNKKFWKSIKPWFSDNINSNETITLMDKGEGITNNGKVANVLNNFFSNMVDLLEISEKSEIINKSDHIEDDVEITMVKYNKHQLLTTMIYLHFNSGIDNN